MIGVRSKRPALLVSFALSVLGCRGSNAPASERPIGSEVQARFNSVQVKAGDTAPPFSLRASDGKVYDLANYRGKQAVVLAWFVKAFSEP